MAVGFKAQPRGLFGSPNMQARPQLPGMPSEMPRQTPKPQEKPDTGRRVAGYLADFLAGMNGQPGPYFAMQQRQQQAEQNRQRDWEDFTKQYDYKRNNPMPKDQAPDAFDRALAGAGIDPRSEQAQQMYRDRAAALSRDPNDEFVSVNIPGIGMYNGPRSGLAEALGGGRPAKPVGGLMPMQGGTASNGGGSFQR